MGEWTSHQNVNTSLLKPDISLQESQALYPKWAEAGTYDELHDHPSKYGGLGAFIAGVKDLFPNPGEVRVVDVGAGTGLTGEYLHKYGYKHVDAVEPNPDFIKVLEEKKIYGRICKDFFGGDKQMDIPDDTYDALTICGAMGPGHLPCNAITEMIRIVKPGGYIVNCMREEYLWTVPDYKDRLDPLCEKYEKEGRWKKIKREIYPNHFLDKNGVLMIYQVC